MSSRTMNMSEELHSWLLDHVIGEPEPLARLRERTFAEVGPATMQISPEQGRFMAWLVRTLGVKRAIEVGTFTGYSALAVALAMPEDGELICCDVCEEWTRIAREAWADAGVDGKVSLRIAPAVQTLDALVEDGQARSFDLVFIDADKEGYAAYVERALQLLRPGGVIAVDNALWRGRIATDDSSPQTTAIREIVTSLAADSRVSTSMVPIGDGLFLATVLPG